jgi:hypothetical protein
MALLNYGKTSVIDPQNKDPQAAKSYNQAGAKGDTTRQKQVAEKYLLNTGGSNIVKQQGVADASSSEGPVTQGSPDFESDWDVGGPITGMQGDPNVSYYEGGQIRAGNIEDENAQPHTRDVTEPELVQNQLSNLLNSNSKYMQDARRQGLEQANALGGLGGTVGTGASMTSALRAALPIAQQDAATFTKVASENMQALNQFSQLNHQRATQLALGEMDSNTRVMTANISASASLAQTRLQTAAQRDIAWLDSETKQKITQMQGAIQARLAKNQFEYNKILTDMEVSGRLAQTQMQGEYNMANTQVMGEYNLAQQEQVNAMQRETNYTTSATGLYQGYLDRIAALNGMEMDDAARERAIASITEGAKSSYSLLNSLYPELDPIVFDW